MGMIDTGETPAEAAAREVEEETGWRPGQLQPLLVAQPTAGIMDAAHHIFVGTGAVEVSDPPIASSPAPSSGFRLPTCPA